MEGPSQKKQRTGDGGAAVPSDALAEARKYERSIRDRNSMLRVKGKSYADVLPALSKVIHDLKQREAALQQADARRPVQQVRCCDKSPSY